MRGPVAVLFALITTLAAFAGPAVAQGPAPRHAIAMHGEPKYGPDFKNFAYVNPDAPKGGEVRMSAIGTFDNLNAFIIKGVQPAGIGLLHETLMSESADEAFTEYGQIAESMEVPDDRSWIVFNLRKEAKFHDGKPITADDVLFSFDALKSKGAPFYRFYYAAVDTVEKQGERRVKFSFKPGDNHELPLILGQLPVLSKAYWTGKAFDQTTLTAPVGSGPYMVDSFEPGRFIVYKRVADWWGKDVPVNRGQYNFDRIRYDYYRDTTVALEAFKAGEYDWRLENEAKKWATGYDFPAWKNGAVKKVEFDNDRPAGMQAFAFNTRRPLFADPRVRQALAYGFDFEWANKNLFFGQYTRSNSFFANSELASSGLPTPAEMALLQPLRGKVPDQVFTATYKPPASDGSGNIRDNLRQALALLSQAGWTIKNGRLENAQGQPFQFEILIDQPTWERIALPFVQNLEKLGIKATIRSVDSAQYENRVRDFDFDMITAVWGQSDSPGNEQRDFWGSEAAKTPGSRNVVGIVDPAVDTLVEAVIAAKSREELIAASRALDRVLLWGHYVIPHWYLGKDRVAFWDKFGIPKVVPSKGIQFTTWWLDPAKSAGTAPAKTGWTLPAVIGSAEAQESSQGPAANKGEQGQQPLATPQPTPQPDQPTAGPDRSQTTPGSSVGEPSRPQPQGGDAGVFTPPGNAPAAPNQAVQELPARDAVPAPETQASGWDSPVAWFALAAVAVLIAWRAMTRRRR